MTRQISDDADVSNLPNPSPRAVGTHEGIAVNDQANP